LSERRAEGAVRVERVCVLGDDELRIRADERGALRERKEDYGYTSGRGDETRAIAFCRQCTTWESLAGDDPRLFAAWVTEHACFKTANAPPPNDEFDGWCTRPPSFAHRAVDLTT